MIYELKNGRVNLVYVGAAGKILQNGKVKTAKEGIRNDIINGIQFGEKRSESWKKKVKSEKIHALDIYWYVTTGKDFLDIPSLIKAHILQTHLALNGELPKWNDEI